MILKEKKKWQLLWFVKSYDKGNVPICGHATHATHALHALEKHVEEENLAFHRHNH